MQGVDRSLNPISQRERRQHFMSEGSWRRPLEKLLPHGTSPCLFFNFSRQMVVRLSSRNRWSTCLTWRSLSKGAVSFDALHEEVTHVVADAAEPFAFLSALLAAHGFLDFFSFSSKVPSSLSSGHTSAVERVTRLHFSENNVVAQKRSAGFRFISGQSCLMSFQASPCVATGPPVEVIDVDDSCFRRSCRTRDLTRAQQTTTEVS
jgi:hypothetical protein